ncbi:MAG: hypothetical protein LBN27_10750 [Prevotellaceae bacterium]|jgi:hypothetical protein|nr:hypothetical protein [Prevotellaceae bacterium]
MSKARVAQITKNTSVLLTDVAAYTFNTGSAVSSHTRYNFDNYRNFEADPVTVCGYKMIPYGVNNELPAEIRNVMEKNNLAPSIINREVGLLYGSGPALFRHHYAEGEIHRDYTDDKEIWDWLRSWNYRRYIEQAMVEYKYMGGFFSRQRINVGRRIGQGRINRLEVVPAINARLEWTDSLRIEDVKHIFTGDFDNARIYRIGVATYPIFDPYNPIAHSASMSYHNSYSFGRNFYAMPSYYGTLPWIMRGSDIPEIIRYLTDNGISVAYHVHVPNGYWAEKLEQIEQRFPDKDKSVWLSKLEEIKSELFDQWSKVLSGKENAGKFITTIDFFDEYSGKECSWKIEPIDQQIKDFIDAQIKISGEATSAITSGLGLSPALSNVVLQGKMGSGSELLYALKLYLASDVNIAEEIIFENINQVIAAMFPTKNLKLGFYHPVIKKEEDTKPEERLVNQQ